MWAEDELDFLAEERMGWEGGSRFCRDPLSGAIDPAFIPDFLSWLWIKKDRFPLRYTYRGVSIDDLYFQYIQYCCALNLRPIVKKMQLNRRLRKLGATSRRVGPMRKTVYDLPRISQE